MKKKVEINTRKTSMCCIYAGEIDLEDEIVEHYGLKLKHLDKSDYDEEDDYLWDEEYYYIEREEEGSVSEALSEMEGEGYMFCDLIDIDVSIIVPWDLENEEERLKVLEKWFSEGDDIDVSKIKMEYEEIEYERENDKLYIQTSRDDKGSLECDLSFIEDFDPSKMTFYITSFTTICETDSFSDVYPIHVIKKIEYDGKPLSELYEEETGGYYYDECFYDSNYCFSVDLCINGFTIASSTD